MTTQIIGVKFDNDNKIYYFNSKGIKLRKGDLVVVETPSGINLGKVSIKNHTIPNDTTHLKFKNVIRKAKFRDIRKKKKDKILQIKAAKICNERIKKYKLPIKLIGVKNAFDDSKLTFTFTSDKRIDFRPLVRDLASVFRTRIEMRQIGVRDEARLLGGLGSCGQTVCCARFLRNFQPVSIKMAKDQGLSLKPSKISGVCGRLMCCLKYEQNIYSKLLQTSPKIGAFVETPNGKGVVKELNILAQTVKVQLDSNMESLPSLFNIEDVKIIPK